MSNLISGKEALIALANGHEVEFQEPVKDKWIWVSAKHLTIENILNHTATYTVQKSPSCIEHESYSIQFRLKPKTIKLNNIEVPTPFKPEIGEKVYSLYGLRGEGYESWIVQRKVEGRLVWRTEEEIKQVVEALRQVFKG